MTLTTVPVQAHDIVKKFEAIKLFKGMSLRALEQIAPQFSVARYDKESVVFYERDIPSDSGGKIYCVVSGCVKLVKYSSDGESTIVRLASVGEFFGVTGALTDHPYPFSAEVLNETELLSIGQEQFRDVVRQYPEIALNMVVELGEVLWFNYETHNQVVKKTDSRVSKIILYHLKRDGAEKTADGLQLNILLPHEYIASMTGIAYEESVRIVSRLKKMHCCINYLRGGKIVITDLAKLRGVAQTDEAWGF